MQTEQYTTTDGSEQLVGTACTSFEKDSGFGAGLLPGVPGAAGESGVEPRGFSFTYDGTGNSLRLRVSDSSGHVVAERLYDNTFVDSGRTDELKVDAGNQQLRFVAKGAASCPRD